MRAMVFNVCHSYVRNCSALDGGADSGGQISVSNEKIPEVGRVLSTDVRRWCLLPSQLSLRYILLRSIRSKIDRSEEKIDAAIALANHPITCRRR